TNTALDEVPAEPKNAVVAEVAVRLVPRDEAARPVDSRLVPRQVGIHVGASSLAGERPTTECEDHQGDRNRTHGSVSSPSEAQAPHPSLLGIRIQGGARSKQFGPDARPNG